MKVPPLQKTVQIILILVLGIAGLYFAKPFLAPFTIAILLAMMFLPLTRKMEKKGLSKGISVFICVFILALAIAGIALLLSTQIAGVAEDFPKIKENVSESIDKVKEYISKNAGIPADQQKQMMEEKKSEAGGNAAKAVAGIMALLSGVLVDTVLVFVYVFLLLFLRSHLRSFILKLVPADDKQNAANIMSASSKVVTKYLSGMGMMIASLWVMYGIGFSIVGVKNAIFFAILCGLLEIIPFVGNITGTGITIIMALSQGGGSSMVIGILITYFVVQFVQTYILEPLVVGSEVNINPLFTILIIVIAEMVWGVPGMVVAVPVLGIVKVICDHVGPLKPFGFLIGEEKKSKDGPNLIEKVKGWFK